MGKIPINYDLLAAWLRDADCTAFRYRVFIHRKRGTDDLVVVYDNDKDAYWDGKWTKKENKADRKRVKRHPKRYIEVPVPDHGKVHEWFQDYLASIDRQSEYFGSIGGWLKQDGAYGRSADWEDYRSLRVGRYVDDIISARLKKT